MVSTSSRQEKAGAIWTAVTPCDISRMRRRKLRQRSRAAATSKRIGVSTEAFIDNTLVPTLRRGNASRDALRQVPAQTRRRASRRAFPRGSVGTRRYGLSSQNVAGCHIAQLVNVFPTPLHHFLDA